MKTAPERARSYSLTAMTLNFGMAPLRSPPSTISTGTLIYINTGGDDSAARFRDHGSRYTVFQAFAGMACRADRCRAYVVAVSLRPPPLAAYFILTSRRKFHFASKEAAPALLGKERAEAGNCRIHHTCRPFGQPINSGHCQLFPKSACECRLADRQRSAQEISVRELPIQDGTRLFDCSTPL
ncbi:hypothetical protein ABIE49_006142 [Bradyrhizobium sp. OAE829]